MVARTVGWSGWALAALLVGSACGDPAVAGAWDGATDAGPGPSAADATATDGAAADDAAEPREQADAGVPDTSADAGASPRLDAGSHDAATPDAGPAQTPAARIVHWQVNIEWTDVDMGEDEFQLQVTQKAHLPDLIAAQELWPTPLCGQKNALGQEAKLSLQDCVTESYGSTSFLGLLNAKTGRKYQARYTASEANVVIWDKARFSFVAGTQWRFGQDQALRDACCGGAATEAGCALTELIGIAVLLRDDRGTASVGDDQHVGLCSVHTGGYGGNCVKAHLEHADAVFTGLAHAHPELPLSRRFISGDLNTPADTQSATRAQRKREELPDCWWRSFVAGQSCGSNAGGYYDTVWEKHWDGSTANNAAICSQWTWPMNSGGMDLCNEVVDGAGQVYSRIDYTFAKGTGLTRSLISSTVDRGYYDNDGDGRYDPGEAYSDSHRGVYTEILY